MARGFGPDGAQPPARGEGGEQFVSRVAGVGHYLPCPPQGSGGVQVVEGWQIAANHLLCREASKLFLIIQRLVVLIPESVPF